ncbi:MAG: hypothetical protein SynsKO_08200 [Synoicihabitans sp.]
MTTLRSPFAFPTLQLRCLLTTLLLGLLPLTGFSADVSGKLQQWHTVELTFTGPSGSELNPATFSDHRLTVTFSHSASGTTLEVPGFFAADGNAGQSHAMEGDKWRARFTPGHTGKWTYEAEMVTGDRVAINNDPGKPVKLSGDSGSFTISASKVAASSRDFRGHGRLEYVGKHHMQFAGSQQFFLMGGAGSPENFLAFDGIDGTYDFAKTPEFPSLGEDQLHHFGPHRRDWRPGDPNWTDEDGDDAKGIIGLVNYLSDQGLNSIYLMPFTYAGDGSDIWPWYDPQTRRTFDVSKLAHWERIFSHLQHQGIHIHMLVTETENESLFEVEDGGAPFADTRKLYYRELIARFAHHLALSWDLGEETGWTDEKGGEVGIGITTAQQKAFATYIRDLDPYNHPIKIHEIEMVEIYPQLAGFENFEGPALQRHHHYNQRIIEHLEMSVAAGKPWLVSMSEPLGWEYGLRPDADDPTRDVPRKDVLWGVFMAGGSGVEWYAGWQNNAPTSDLSSEDLRVREKMWKLTKIALDFFYAHIPFQDMTAANDLVGREDVYVLSKPNDTYLVYLKEGGQVSLDLSGAKGKFNVSWFDPLQGGKLQKGTVRSVNAGGNVALGNAPHSPGQDWAVLLTRP